MFLYFEVHVVKLTSILCCAEITDAVNSFANLSNPEKNNHKELFVARVKKDHDDYVKLKSGFEGLVTNDIGLTDVEENITLVQNQITGKSFSEYSFK